MKYIGDLHYLYDNNTNVLLHFLRYDYHRTIDLYVSSYDNYLKVG